MDIHDSGADELRTLRRTMRDMVALSTLPAVWGALSHHGIAESLVTTLLKTLGLDLVYLRIARPGESLVEAAKSKHNPDVSSSLPEVRAALAPLLSETVPVPVISVPDPFGKGQVRATLTRFGLVEDHGILIAACSRASFPTEQDRLLLGYAANQVAIISQRRRAEQALHQSEQRFLEFADSAPAILWATELDGSRSFLSHGWYEFTAQPQSDGLKFGWMEVVHPEDREEARKKFLDANGLKQPFAIEYRLRRADGEYRWMIDTGKPHISSEKGFLGYVGNILDITDRKQAEAEQQRLLLEVESERTRLAEIFQQSPSFMSILSGPDHVIERANAQYLQLVGQREVLGKPVREALPEVVEQGFVDLLDKVYQTGETFTGRNVRVDLQREPSGPLRESYVDFVYQPIRNPDGAVSGIFVQGVDLTERKRAEEALQDETRILELLNQSGQSLAATLDLNTLLQSVTDAGRELINAEFGAFFYNGKDASGDAYLLYTLSGAPREAFERFGHPRATAVFKPTFLGEPAVRSDDITQDPRYGKMAPHYGMPKGHLPVKSYLAAPVVSNSGDVIGGLFFGHSKVAMFTERSERLITGLAAQAAIAVDNARLYDLAQKAAEERQALLARERAARAEAERLNRSKDEFLAMLAHELRNPLAPVSAAAEILKFAGNDPNRVRQVSDIVSRQMGHFTRLIDDLMDVSRVTRGLIRLETEPLDLKTIINVAVEQVRPIIEARQHSLTIHVNANQTIVDGDRTRLVQVIANLLTNAARYTPAQGKITLEVEADDDHAKIVVTDNGNGIEASLLPHVFDLFTQGNRGLDRSQGGLGIGLALVKAIVALHHGEVVASSKG